MDAGVALLLLLNLLLEQLGSNLLASSWLRAGTLGFLLAVIDQTKTC
jgi:hypothetical protein